MPFLKKFNHIALSSYQTFNKSCLPITSIFSLLYYYYSSLQHTPLEVTISSRSLCFEEINPLFFIYIASHSFIHSFLGFILSFPLLIPVVMYFVVSHDCSFRIIILSTICEVNNFHINYILQM